MRLLLVRHGETIWNAERRMQGATDVPLSEAGRAQAVQLAARLKDEPIAAIYASDLQRASETAAILADIHDLPVQTDSRLREQSKGEWEGLTWPEIDAQYPGAAQRWRADRSQPPSSGEGVSAVADRVRAALDAIRAAHGGEDTVLLVGHGMAMRTLICVALGIDPMIGWQFVLGNTALSELRFSADRALLVRLNDTGHLT
jgi:probable phosphoglycerate mutase